MIELSKVDGTGHAWRPREGDLVRERESGRYGVVLEVRQTANAPAYAQVALTDESRSWSIAEVDAEQLERDTRDDVEVPSLREITMELAEAASRVLDDMQLLAQLRARVATSDELVGVLEIEATRCMRVGDAAVAVHRYDIAARVVAAMARCGCAHGDRADGLSAVRPRNRLSLLLRALDHAASATVADLAQRLGATPATVRRDLADLREAGVDRAAEALTRT